MFLVTKVLLLNFYVGSNVTRITLNYRENS